MRRQQASESASAWLTASGKVYDEFITPLVAGRPSFSFPLDICYR